MTGITREELGLHQRWAEVAMREQQPVTTINTVVLYELCRRALTEQSRIDEAVAKERERCIAVVRFYNGMEQGAHRALRDLLSTTPTTEEGA